MQGIALKKIVKYATAKGFTDIAVFNEDRKQVNGLLLIHLPAGPTAHFRLSSLKLSRDIKVRLCGCPNHLYHCDPACLRTSCIVGSLDICCDEALRDAAI